MEWAFSQTPRIQRPSGRIAAPPVERLQGGVSGPCRGIKGGPQQADFPGFRGGGKREIHKVCTTLPCLPQLKTAKEGIRLIPIRRCKSAR